MLMAGVVTEKISAQIISLCARLAVIFKHITDNNITFICC
jgi:hypothetical protein